MSEQVFAFENPRFRWLVRRVHGLGPRVMGELLAEIGAEYLIRTPIDQKLERYATLDLEVLRVLGGHRFPANPMHLIRGEDDR